MREKDTEVALANGSPMIKLVEFLVSLREKECNSVCLEFCTLFLVLCGLFIASCSHWEPHYECNRR